LGHFFIRSFDHSIIRHLNLIRHSNFVIRHSPADEPKKKAAPIWTPLFHVEYARF